MPYGRETEEERILRRLGLLGKKGVRYMPLVDEGVDDSRIYHDQRDPQGTYNPLPDAPRQDGPSPMPDATLPAPIRDPKQPLPDVALVKDPSRSMKTAELLGDAPRPNASDPLDKQRADALRRQTVLAQAKRPDSPLGKNNDRGWKGRLWDIGRGIVEAMGAEARQQRASGQVAREGYDVWGLLGAGGAGGARGGFDPGYDERRAVQREADLIDQDLVRIGQQKEVQQKEQQRQLKMQIDQLNAQKIAQTIQTDAFKNDPVWLVALQTKRITPQAAEKLNKAHGLQLNPESWQRLVEEEVEGRRYIRTEFNPTYQPNPSIPVDRPQTTVESDLGGGQKGYTTSKQAVKDKQRRDEFNAQQGYRAQESARKARQKAVERGITAQNKHETALRKYNDRISRESAKIEQYEREAEGLRSRYQQLSRGINEGTVDETPADLAKVESAIQSKEGQIARARRVVDDLKKNPPKRPSVAGVVTTKAEFTRRARARGLRGKKLREAIKQAMKDGVIQ